MDHWAAAVVEGILSGNGGSATMHGGDVLSFAGTPSVLGIDTFDRPGSAAVACALPAFLNKPCPQMPGGSRLPCPYSSRRRSWLFARSSRIRRSRRQARRVETTARYCACPFAHSSPAHANHHADSDFWLGPRNPHTRKIRPKGVDDNLSSKARPVTEFAPSRRIPRPAPYGLRHEATRQIDNSCS